MQERGLKISADCVLLLVLPNERADGLTRAGFTVSSKVGNAVVRNRIRRRLKEAMRVHAADDMAQGSDYVIVARRDVLAAPFSTLKAELARRIRGTDK